MEDGRLLYRLKRRWRDGTTHIVFEPLELLEKLAALVPPPRSHQVRYHGILGPAARDRPVIVPGAGTDHPGSTGRSEAAPTFVGDCGPGGAAGQRNAREGIQAILEHLGLPSRAPPITPAHRRPENSGPEIYPEEPAL